MKKILTLSTLALALSAGIAPATYAHCDHYSHVINKLISQIDLTADQQTKIDTIRAQTKQTIKPLREQMHAIHEQIHAAYQTSTMDESKIDGFVSQEKDIIGNIIKAKMMQGLAISNILTADQKTKLETLIQQWKDKRDQEKQTNQNDDDVNDHNE